LVNANKQEAIIVIKLKQKIAKILLMALRKSVESKKKKMLLVGREKASQYSMEIRDWKERIEDLEAYDSYADKIIL
jgi:hypothetical protein